MHVYIKPFYAGGKNCEMSGRWMTTRWRSARMQARGRELYPEPSPLGELDSYVSMQCILDSTDIYYCYIHIYICI